MGLEAVSTANILFVVWRFWELKLKVHFNSSFELNLSELAT